MARAALLWLLIAKGVAGCKLPESWQVEYVALTDTLGKVTYDLGQYDACVNLSFSSPFDFRRKLGVAGQHLPAAGGKPRPELDGVVTSDPYAQYCLLTSGGVVYGICVPKTCSMPQAVSNLTNDLLLWLEGQLEALVVLDSYDAAYSCGDHAQPFSTAGLAVLYYLAAAAAVAIVGTALAHRRALLLATARARGSQDKRLLLSGALAVGSKHAVEVEDEEEREDDRRRTTADSITGPLFSWLAKTESMDHQTGPARGRSPNPPSRRAPPPGGRPLLYSFDEDLDDGNVGSEYEYGGGGYRYGAGTRAGGSRETRGVRDEGGHQTGVGPGCRSAVRACIAGVAGVFYSLWKASNGLLTSFALWSPAPGADDVTETAGQAQQPVLPPGLPPHARWLTAHIPVLDGLRVLSAVWSIIGYSVFLATVPGMINAGAILPPQGVAGGPWFQLVTSAPLAADTALLICGFLATRSLLVQAALANSDGGAGVYTVGCMVCVAARRLSRLLPLALFSAMLVAFALPSLGSGPFWHHLLAHMAPCTGVLLDSPVKADFSGNTPTPPPGTDGTATARRLEAGAMWWTVPALVNNLYPGSGGPPATCMWWTAYAAAATQLAILVAPVLVHVYVRSANIGMVVTLSAITASLVSGQYAAGQTGASGLPDYMAMVNSIGATPGPVVSQAYDAYWDAYLSKPWARAPSFLVGTALAFVCDRLAIARHRRAASVPALGLASPGGLGIETYVGLHHGAGAQERASTVAVPGAMESWLAWLVQGLALAAMGLAVFVPMLAFGSPDGSIEGWSPVAATSYSVLAGPGWACGLATLLFVVLTQGPAALIGEDGAPGPLAEGHATPVGVEPGVLVQAPMPMPQASPMPYGMARQPSAMVLSPRPVPIQALDTSLGGPGSSRQALRSPGRAPSTPALPIARAQLVQAPLSPKARTAKSSHMTTAFVPGPDIVLTPVLSSPLLRQLAPLSTAVVFLGPALILAVYAQVTQWHRYSPSWLVATAGANIIIVFAASAVAYLLVQRPWTVVLDHLGRSLARSRAASHLWSGMRDLGHSLGGAFRLGADSGGAASLGRALSVDTDGRSRLSRGTIWSAGQGPTGSRAELEPSGHGSLAGSTGGRASSMTSVKTAGSALSGQSRSISQPLALPLVPLGSGMAGGPGGPQDRHGVSLSGGGAGDPK